MRILVTGHLGFIGSHVFRALKADGHDVGGVDWPENLAYASRIHEPDAIVNLAAVGGAGLAYRAMDMVMTNNVQATISLRSAMTDKQSRRVSVVHISSFSVYGDAPVPTTEDAPLRPKEIYGASKLAQELCWTGYPGPLTILRLSSVYGPGMKLDDPESTVIAKIAKAARDGTTFEVFEDGKQTRDFVHVNDVVKMIRFAIVEPYGVVNVCSGRGVSILDACRALGATFHVSGRSRPGDMRDCRGDPSTMRLHTGCEPHPFTPRDILCAAS